VNAHSVATTPRGSSPIHTPPVLQRGELVHGRTVGLHLVARRLGRTYVAFESILDVAPDARERASHCAPAAALAALASVASA
jgi:hypothetical protein